MIYREGVELLEKYRLAGTGGANLAHMTQTAGPETGDARCKLFKNLVARVGVEPTAR